MEGAERGMGECMILIAENTFFPKHHIFFVVVIIAKIN